MTTARIWDILAYSAAQYWWIGEIEFRTSAGGSDATATGGSAISQTITAPYVAANAFDNTNTTACVIQDSGTYDSRWRRLGWDFGVGNEKDIVEVVLTAHDVNYTQMPSYFVLRYSTDGGSTYVPVMFGKCATWTAGASQTFTVPNSQASARYFLLAVEGHPPSNWCIGEIALKNGTGGANLFTGGTASSTTIYGGGYEASKALDGSAATIFANSGPAGWWQYDRGSGNGISWPNTFVLTGRSDAYATESGLTSGYLCAGNDGTNFDVISRIVPSLPWSLGQVQTFSFSTNVSVSATGASATGSVGTATVSGFASVSATGASATGSVGTAAVPITTSIVNFTTTGSDQTWTCPDGVAAVIVELVGGGGNGETSGSAEAGGGGGGYVSYTATVVPGNSYRIDVPAGALGTGTYARFKQSDGTVIAQAGSGGNGSGGTGGIGGSQTAPSGATSYTGGNGGARAGSGSNKGGGGGGGAAGPSGNGSAGTAGSGTNGGVGGASGGGFSGSGGNGGNKGVSGSSGIAYGGGGGGGGSNGGNRGSGMPGAVRLTYTITSPNTSVTLSGNSSTAVVGNVTVSTVSPISVSVSGVAATTGIGTQSVTLSATLVNVTGVGSTASVGDETLTTYGFVYPTGVLATAGIGTASATMLTTALVTGALATASVGSASIALGYTISASGVEATGSAGSVSVAAKASVTASGSSATAGAGIAGVSVSGRISVGVTGLAATASAGTADASGPGVATVTGVSATSAVGTTDFFAHAYAAVSGLQASLGTSGTGDILTDGYNVTGVSATTGLGTVAVFLTGGFAMTGAEATATTGDVIVAINGAVVFVTGVEATLYDGDPLPYDGDGVWVSVDERQSPAWAPT